MLTNCNIPSPDSSLCSDLCDLNDLRPLAVFADDVSSETISPSGKINETSPAGRYLIEQDWGKKSPLGDFASHDKNDHLMIRGTFDHPCLNNTMTPNAPGAYTQYFGDAHVTAPDHYIPAAKMAKATFIFDAAIAYQQSGRQLTIIAGENYGCGPTQHWAAKGSALLGVKSIIAKSIHENQRTQLLRFGILPLTFKNKGDYQRVAHLHSSIFSIVDITESHELKHGQSPSPQSPAARITLVATLLSDCGLQLPLIAELHSFAEIEFYLSGGIAPYSLNPNLEGHNSASSAK